MKQDSGSNIKDQIITSILRKTAPITVIVPAYNEVDSIALTLHSLIAQTTPPEQIIVVDDFSSDHTGEIARSFPGVTVMRPSKNTGSKAGAQNYALPFVTSKYTSAVDADTTLADDAIEKMIAPMDLHPETVASCSFVLPKNINTLWERGRFIEYIFTFTFFKRIQDWYDKPLICSGCFSVYRTKDLKDAGGWSTRTLAEDMDLTWSFYEAGKVVRFNKDAFCYPIEPRTFQLMSKQLKRWSHGWFQNLKIHWKKLREIPVAREFVLMQLLDAMVGTAIWLAVAPVLAIVHHDPILYLYVTSTDIVFIAIPAAWKGYQLGMLRKVLTSLPAFFLLRLVNSYFYITAAISEFLLKKSFTKYEKGH